MQHVHVSFVQYTIANPLQSDQSSFEDSSESDISTLDTLDSGEDCAEPFNKVQILEQESWHSCIEDEASDCSDLESSFGSDNVSLVEL